MDATANRDYYLSREQAARLLAEQSTDPAARRSHLTMAKAYARKAAELAGTVLPPAPGPTTYLRD